MRIRVTPSGLSSENTRQVRIAQRIYLLSRDLPQLATDQGSPSPTALERDLRDGGVSYVVADDDSLRIVADQRGNQHLYCHRIERPTGAELTVTDDLFSFAGILPIDDDVAQLVPLMKYVPPPLCLVQGAERVPPGVARVYDRRSLRPLRDENFLAELFSGGTAPVSHDEVRDTLAAIIAEKARHLSTAAVFLSGGSNSALLVHLLRQSGHCPQTWTAEFGTAAGRREVALAASTAARYAVSWRSVSVNKDTTLRHLPAILAAIKEPFTDVAVVAEAILGLAMRQEMEIPVA